MLNSGDIVEVDLGMPAGSGAGLLRAAVVVTAAPVLRRNPNIIHVVPFTRTLRNYATEITVAADQANGLTQDSAVQCQHIRAVATNRVRGRMGNVGPTMLAQIRDTLAVLLDL